MDRRKAAVFVLCASVSLSGCESEQGRWLAQRQRQLDLALAEKAEIAQNLNERRRELDVLEERLAGLRARLNRPSAEDFTRLLSGQRLESLTFREEAGVLHVRFGGSGGASRLLAALRALSASERAIVLKRVSVEPRAWSVELEVPAVPRPSVQATPYRAGLPVPMSPMPPPGFFASLHEPGSVSRQREFIRRTEQRIAELDKVLGEVSRLYQRKAEAEAHLRALEELGVGGRLAEQRALVEALFGGRKPRLLTGVAEFQGRQLTLRGLGQGEAAKRLASLSQVGQVVEAGTDAIVISTAAPQ